MVLTDLAHLRVVVNSDVTAEVALGPGKRGYRTSEIGPNNKGIAAMPASQMYLMDIPPTASYLSCSDS